MSDSPPECVIHGDGDLSDAAIAALARLLLAAVELDESETAELLVGGQR